MDHQDRQAIEGLFNRLAEVERRSPPRDADAEAFIRDRIARQPGAPYYMAQTIVMQELALEDAQRRIDELERSLAERPAGGGGLFGGLFGSGRPAGRTGSVPTMPRERMYGGGYGGAAPMPPSYHGGRGGGFLAGAAQTAMGVAGGVLLGNAIAGMFGGDEENVADAAGAAAQEPAAEQASEDSGGFFGDMFGGDEEV